MSCKQMNEIALLLCIFTLTFHTTQTVCASANAETLKNVRWFPVDPSKISVVDRLQSIQQGNIEGGRVDRGAPVQLNRPYIRSSDVPRKQFNYNGVPKRTGIANYSSEAITRFSWTYGDVHRRSQSSDTEDGYQSDFPGFQDVRGEVSFDSSPYFSEWLAMRPFVQCHKDIMTFTASVNAYAHLFVDREGAAPISLFHIPSSCGFSVKGTRQDFVMMASYDGCYITQEDGHYVLPLLWWGSPLKLSCPVQHPSSPTILCSPYGMVVRIHGIKEDIPALAVIVNGTRGLFVSANCAYRVQSKPTELIFFIPFGAPCVTFGAGPCLLLLLHGQEYALSCPVRPPPPPYSPPYLLPATPGGDPWFPPPAPPPPYSPLYLLPATPGGDPWYPMFPPPAPPPTLNNQPWFPQAYHLHPQHRPGGSPPGPQQSFYPMDLEQQHPLYYPYTSVVAVEAQPGPPQTLTVPPGPPQPLSDPYSTYFHPYPAVSQVAPSATVSRGAVEVPPFHPYLLPHFPPAAPPPPPKDPEALQYPGVSSYPWGSQVSYYPSSMPEWCLLYDHPVCRYYHPTSPPAPEPLPTLSPAYPSATQAPPTVTTTTAARPAPSPLSPSIWCLSSRMVAFLPWARMDSIQVKDQGSTWLHLSSVPPRCGYRLERTEKPGVIFHSPLPSCHTQERGSNTIYLRLKIWDTSTGKHRAMELQCPYRGIQGPSTPPPAHLTVPGSVDPPLVPMPTVYCSSQKMTVELPPGPVSGIVVKDLQGNRLNLDNADDCGYSSSKQKDGTILLNFPYTVNCRLSVKGNQYMVNVIYVTPSGQKELQMSCPVAVPGSSKGCSLPPEQRLPCGSGSPSPAQCTSLGCCFSPQPPDCYYPMDECSRDNHFVFTVPASLTDPPLSPASLVAAGDPSCKPRKVTRNYALFKIPMDGCGARRLAIGKAVIYVVEIHNLFQSITLNYGSITRDSPIRLLVECRYLPGSVSASYLVKTPSLGPSVHQEGVFGVQLRIAKDGHYSDYYPQYHRPLQMLLGKPLHLEVRLLHAPDPTVRLLVHYCLAYPRSGRAVWVLLYNGCPNPLDPASKQMALAIPPPGSPLGHTRRFTISTFQFLQDGKPMDPDEEIYFMCSTEVCSPRDGPCVEGCFSQ